MARPRRGLRSVAVPAAAPDLVRAAIYTRKSTDQGLDTDFTSLDNQRERGEAYVASQGWHLVPTRYDDGGFSGGNTDRPALRQLLNDVEAGEINAIVVYKLDRLSRSLLDFLQIHRFLERHRASIISVTEPIDTTTPMGRGFVNVLLSFGQMEREVAGERTRHKIESARRRGKWTGGRPVLGYDTVPEGGGLVINKGEAGIVRSIFELYAESRSLVSVVQVLDERGWRQKRWITKTGRECGGGQWNKSSLRTLLTNPLYIGMQKLGGETFRGEHKAIVPRALFEKVQRLIKENRGSGGAPSRNRHGALLRGLLRCTDCDASMSFAPTRRNGKLYRYYRRSASMKRGRGTCSTGCLPADRVEGFVVDQIRRIGADPRLQAETFRQAVAQVKAQRRGLKRERKTLERDLITARADVERLVGAVSRVTGSAADAIASELEKVQDRVRTIDGRLCEIADELTALKAQDVDRDHLAGALVEFTPIWDVLLTPERERVLRLLIDRVNYNGGSGEMSITWRLSGFGELAAEVAP